MRGNRDSWCCSDIIKDFDEFVIYTFDDTESETYQRMAFDEIEVARDFKQGTNPLSSEQRKIVDKLTSKESFLDKVMNDEKKQQLAKTKAGDEAGDANFERDSNTELIYGMPIEEFDKKFRNIKKKFKKKRREFEANARNALLEAAKLYLGDKHEDAYVKYKLELSQSGLGSIMYQIHTMEETLHTLISRIKVAGAFVATRDIEVFTGLQRIILDAQKFQFEYMQSVETSMKELKIDMELAAHVDGQDEQHAESVTFFRGGKDFIKSLMEMKNSMNEFTPSASKNKLLNPEAEATDIQFEEAIKMDTDGPDILDNTRNPFTGYEGAAKKPKKYRDGEEEGMEDFDI